MSSESEFLCFPPFSDELLTSWMVRNALTFGIKPSKLSYLCFENSDQWKSDIDVFLGPKQISALSDKTGIPPELIHTTTFNGSCSYFYTPSGKTPQIKWVMSLGVRAQGKHYGLQFCPCCLAEDGNEPYFRRHWRLAFMTCCPFHSVQLHDRCPKCSAPIDLKRIRKSDERQIFHPEDIVKCSNCGFDLRLSNYQIPTPEELSINLRQFSMYQLGYGKIGNQEFNYSNLYFDGVRRLMSFLLLKSKGKDLMNRILENSNQDTHYLHFEAIPKYSEPETIELSNRRNAIICLQYLMCDWPDRFVSSSKEMDIFKQDIFSGWLDYPFWFYSNITFLIKREWMPFSDIEREACKTFLETKLHRNVQTYEISRTLKKIFGSEK